MKSAPLHTVIHSFEPPLSALPVAERRVLTVKIKVHMIPKSKIYIMGFVTLIGFPLLGVTIVGFVEDNPYNFNWFWEMIWWQQLLLGGAAGTAAGFLAWGLISTDFLKPTLEKYGNLIGKMNLNNSEIIFLSICAGFGEEILFRAVLQQYWGIWITALVFVAIHGYLDPRNMRMVVYGLTMTIIIAGVGYLYEYSGLLAAAAAHTMIDVVLFKKLSGYDYAPVQKKDQPEIFDSDK